MSAERTVVSTGFCVGLTSGSFSKSREVEYKTREKGTTRYAIEMRGHSSVKIGFAYSEKRITRRHISF